MATLNNKYSYFAVVAIRFLFVFVGLGYIHPDSFFQSTEIVAGDVFGFDVTRTWEFDKSYPCRTIVTPAIVSGIPFLALKGLSYVIPSIINSYTLLYLPRLMLFLTSFILDYVVWQLSGHDFDALLTLGTSWVMFSYMLSSFSNTMEAIILAVTLYYILRTKVKTWNEYALFGALVAFGEFTRITFILYAFPLGLFLLYEELSLKDKGDWTKLVTGILTGFAIVSTIIILIDSVYFGSIAISIGGKYFRWLDLLCPSFYVSLITNLSSLSLESLTWTITPINSISYNSKTENLDEHGTHLRITHLFNLFVLYGPLAYVGLEPYYTWLDTKLGELTGQIKSKKLAAPIKKKPPKAPTVVAAKASAKPGGVRVVEGTFAVTKLAILGSILCGFICLSIVPHQEMRFLLPILVPLVLLGYKGIFGNQGFFWLKVGWIAFNITLLIYVGVLHQGGVVPIILKLSNQPVEPATTHHVIFYHTYMPPQHLFAITPSGGKPKHAIYDLKGGTLTELRKTLLRIPEQFSFSASDKIFVVSPATVNMEEITSNLEPHSKQWFHLSSEDPPESVISLPQYTLNVYVYDPSKPLRPLVQQQVRQEETFPE